MQGTKEKRTGESSFQDYLKRFSLRYKETTKKGPSDYVIESPFGTLIAAVLEYDASAEIREKLEVASKRSKPFKKEKAPFMPVLYKGGLPGLEHRYIQEALQEEHYPEISAIALLEGRPGQEHLRIFHNRFAKQPLDHRIFDHDKDKNLFLAKIFPNHFFWIVEDAI
jgi:hypothetical protein